MPWSLGRRQKDLWILSTDCLTVVGEEDTFRKYLWSPGAFGYILSRKGPGGCFGNPLCTVYLLRPLFGLTMPFMKPILHAWSFYCSPTKSFQFPNSFFFPSQLTENRRSISAFNSSIILTCLLHVHKTQARCYPWAAFLHSLYWLIISDFCVLRVYGHYGTHGALLYICTPDLLLPNKFLEGRDYICFHNP